MLEFLVLDGQCIFVPMMASFPDRQVCGLRIDYPKDVDIVISFGGSSGAQSGDLTSAGDEMNVSVHCHSRQFCYFEVIGFQWVDSLPTSFDFSKAIGRIAA